MTHTQVKELVQALLDAPTSNPTLKEFAQSWINAEGKPEQEALTKQLVSVAEQNNSYPLRSKTLHSSTKQSALQALNLVHKFLVQKAQLIYYNTLKTLRQKALNFATVQDAQHVNTLSI